MYVYVDNLLAIMKDPASFFNTLTTKYNYKLKGVEEPKYHLGGNYFHDPDGTHNMKKDPLRLSIDCHWRRSITQNLINLHH